MALAVRTRLGPYEIVALIGAGGMGEVYRARDTRLNREVAIKICIGQFTERFAQEGRAQAPRGSGIGPVGSWEYGSRIDHEVQALFAP